MKRLLSLAAAFAVLAPAAAWAGCAYHETQSVDAKPAQADSRQVAAENAATSPAATVEAAVRPTTPDSIVQTADATQQDAPPATPTVN